MKYKNGRDIKAGDKVSGPDWFGRTVTGIVVAGEKPHHKPFALKHGVDGHICPSLNLSQFLPVEDAKKPDAQQEPKPVKPSTGSL